MYGFYLSTDKPTVVKPVPTKTAQKQPRGKFGMFVLGWLGCLIVLYLMVLCVGLGKSLRPTRIQIFKIKLPQSQSFPQTTVTITTKTR